MKYEVPVLNISRFSVENVVTTSSGDANALNSSTYDSINSAITNGAITGATNTKFVKTTMADWVK